jgi:hypothetical protein
MTENIRVVPTKNPAGGRQDFVVSMGMWEISDVRADCYSRSDAAEEQPAADPEDQTAAHAARHHSGHCRGLGSKNLFLPADLQQIRHPASDCLLRREWPVAQPGPDPCRSMNSCPHAGFRKLPSQENRQVRSRQELQAGPASRSRHYSHYHCFHCRRHWNYLFHRRPPGPRVKCKRSQMVGYRWRLAQRVGKLQAPLWKGPPRLEGQPPGSWPALF